MRQLRYALILIFLAGCATLADYTPSLKYCHEVTYTRVGPDLELNAKCRVPIGG